MTTIYFAGQDNFGNRGCEALIRSNIKTIKKYIPNSHFIVPTKDENKDSHQWPEAVNNGVKFVMSEPMPKVITWWSRLRRVLSSLDGHPPYFKISEHTRNAILDSDAFIMTGGDIVSLDYGLESLYYWSHICRFAMDNGKPTVLWAASVGPFTSDPRVERIMKKFLLNFSLITVRETASLKYLQALGVNNVELVIDSAFALDSEKINLSDISILEAGQPVLGFNVSPLIRKFRDDDDDKDALDNEVADFLIKTLADSTMNILLIPHVDPLDGSDVNSDSAYMKKIISKVQLAGFDKNRIDILPRTLNAAQLKDVISRCSYFMGARTHATVAALSKGVPTISIAYSIKAKGINYDLFGHLDYVLETANVTTSTLSEHLKNLIDDSSDIKSHLKVRMPEWKDKADLSAKLLVNILP